MAHSHTITSFATQQVRAGYDPKCCSTRFPTRTCAETWPDRMLGLFAVCCFLLPWPIALSHYVTLGPSSSHEQQGQSSLGVPQGYSSKLALRSFKPRLLTVS